MKHIILIIIVCISSCGDTTTKSTKVDSTQVGITKEQWETAQQYQHFNTVIYSKQDTL